jgi:hypothetical protein
MPILSLAAVTAAFALSASATLGCRDLSRFSSNGDGFEGPVVSADFVRAGIARDVRMCLTFDTEHLQDGPGTMTTTDGRFQRTPLRPIPQVWHDPLSTLSFGDGRVRNVVYAASPSDGGAEDVLVVVSLMKSGNVEVRLLRGAPQTDASVAAAQSPPLFGVFNLERRAEQPCPP